MNICVGVTPRKYFKVKKVKKVIPVTGREGS
jgi:hypothetical protein